MRKYVLFALLAVFVLSSFALPPKSFADDQKGILKGRIFDASSKDGIGGVQVLVTGPNSKTTATTDDFGDFSMELAPGNYIAQIQQIEQKIGFVILPGKTALLNVPLKASAAPSNAPISYTVSYAQNGDQAPPPDSNRDSNGDKKVQPFIQPDAAPQPAVAPQPQPAPQPAPPDPTAYPMTGMIATAPPPPPPPGKGAPTIAIVEFKDTTGRDLGLMTAQDMAQFLFDMGVVKIVGPDSVSAAIGGEPADPLNGAFGQWVSEKLGADVVVLGHLKVARLEHHQYFFIVAERAVEEATVVVMDSRTGNILANFSATGESGITGSSSGKDRYFQDQTIRSLYAKASNDLAEKLARRLLEVENGLKAPADF